MKYFLTFLIYTIAIITIKTGISMLKYKSQSRKQYVIYAISAFCSGIWSIGFSMIWIQTNPEIARIWRAIGMIGVFCMFVALNELFLEWLQGAVILKIYSRVITLIGVCLWPFLIGPNSVSFATSSLMGMSYILTPNIWNTIYNVICVLVGVNYFLCCYIILKQAKSKKKKVFVKRVMICCVIVLVGMVFDTILPLFGIEAFPGSTITQGIGVLCMASVLNFRKKTEITVENISEFVYYSVDTPVMIYDEEGNFQIANSGANEFFAKADNDWRKKGIGEIFNLSKWDIAFRDEKVNTVLKEAECVLNKRYCQVQISKLYDEYHEIIGYIMVLNDLTEKRDFIEKLQESEKRADMANKAKTNFLARMSHEIRTPINGILGLNDMILQRSEEQKTIEHAHMVKISAQHLLELINDILDISKIEANKMEIMNNEYQLQKLLIELLASNEIRAKNKNLELSMEVINPLPCKVYGDEKKIRQIVLNIVSNAIKYTSKGSVQIKVSSYIEEEQFYLKFVVIDTGVGIEEKNLDRIFESFERVDTAKNIGIEGTGLGLAIVKNMITLLGGEVTVVSEYGVGSVFTVIFPQKIIEENYFDSLVMEGNRDEEKPADMVTLQIPNKKILVVDDNEINLIVASELLGYTKASVETVDGGIPCIEIIKKEKYDFILLDHIMPDMDGIKTLKEIKKLSEDENKSFHAIIIALTANAIEGSKEDYIKQGFDDYLPKPIDMNQVQEVLRKYC